MWHAIGIVGGFIGGLFAYHFLAAKLFAEFDAIHQKLDKVIAAIKN